jgi:hypothetical protein
MQVLGDPRASWLSDINTHRGSIGIQDMFEHPHECLRDLHEGAELFFRHLADIGLMGMRHNEQMSIIAGITRDASASVFLFKIYLTRHGARNLSMRTRCQKTDKEDG